MCVCLTVNLRENDIILREKVSQQHVGVHAFRACSRMCVREHVRMHSNGEGECVEREGEEEKTLGAPRQEKARRSHRRQGDVEAAGDVCGGERLPGVHRLVRVQVQEGRAIHLQQGAGVVVVVVVVGVSLFTQLLASARRSPTTVTMRFYMSSISNICSVRTT